MNNRQLNNQRQKKIEYLKSLIAGTMKPLDGQTLLWEKEDGIWCCTNETFKHLRFATDEELRAFTRRYGGHHIMFCSFSGDDEPIKDEPIIETPTIPISTPIVPDVFKWTEEKVYEHTEQPKPEESESVSPQPVKQPKKPKKERKQRAAKVNPMEARKAKLKADHQKVLAQIEHDQKRIDSMNDYKRINREFI